MRKMLFSMLMLISVAGWAGGEVPWPKESQEDIQLRDLGGLWVSKTLDTPQRMFYFSLERGGISEACPYILRVFELDSKNSHIIAAGGGVYCQEQVEAIAIVMYDFEGHARNSLNLVGLRKPAGSFELGNQLLGVTLSTYGDEPSVLAQDTFYMISQ